jgi:hypothetical protein
MRQDCIQKVSKGKFAFMMILLSLMLGTTGFIGSDVKAQSDGMDPLAMHIHPSLSLFVNGTSVIVPAQIGIDPTMWKDHSLDEFGMQSMPEMNMSAMSPLHTHDDSGVIHVESTIDRDYTLLDFMNIWGLDLNGKVLRMTVDDRTVSNISSYSRRW